MKAELFVVRLVGSERKPMLHTGLIFAIALLTALAMTPLVRRFALRIGFVARPNERSMHQEPKPYLGGLAIFLAFAVAVVAGYGFRDEKILGILTGGLLVLLLGILDDRYDLKPVVKLLGQVVAAAVLVYVWDVRIYGIINPFNETWLSFGWWSGPLTLFWIVAFMNVVNFIDGLDGLAAGISSIAALTLLLVAMQQQQSSAVLLTAALAGASIGFLRYNFNPAKIFMGDAGAMFLGYILAAVSVHGVLKSAATVGVIVPVLALALPIFDTAFAIVRRVSSGRSIGQADKDHLHHRLLRLGLSHRSTVLVMWAASAWIGLSAVAVADLTLSRALIILGMVALVVLFVAARAGLLGVGREQGKSANR
jgi:UDP-GlcNAc:undecaprenyl-phosphate/decaprenyl-phosphate GlcNAc-1-phosphate transferase